MKKYILHIAPILAVLTIFCTISYGQYREPLFNIHDRGRLWETVKDNGQIGGRFSDFQFYPSMDWPGGPAILPNKDEQRSYSQGGGFWVGGKNPDGSIFLDEMGPFTYVDQGTFFDMTEVENFVGSTTFDPFEAEEKIIAHWITSRGIEVVRTSRAWSYPSYADFIVLEYVCTNRSADNLTDVYFGFPYLLRPSYQDVVVQGFWGDNPNVDDELVGYDEDRKLLYAYDYQPSFETTWSWGNYWDKRDELRTTGYAGFSPLYADPAKDSRDQPATIFVAQVLNNMQRLTLANQSEANLYAILNGEDRSLMHSLDEDEVLSPFLLQGFGPYDLAPGDTVKIVIVEAVNGLPMEQAVKGLAVQHLLPAGLDSLKNTIDRAQRLFDRNYNPAVLAPPAPAVEYFVLPSTQEIVVTWGSEVEEWINPFTGRNGLSMYRVYRSDRSYIGPFKKLRDVRVARKTDRDRFFDINLDKWKYKDNTVQVGVGYFFAVSSVDSSGNESGLTNINARALVTARTPAENALNVSV
ncbi:MAG: hypothetical protein SCK70_06885, partial [bacterium]|nr:hypothetical protein [bacterium]